MTGPQVRSQPRPVPSVSPDALGAPIAGAVGGISREVMRIAEEERQKVNQVQVNGAEVELRRERDRLLYDRDTGALTRQRKQVIGATNTFADEWKRAESRILAGIVDPDARAEAQARAAQVFAEAETMVRRHADRELDIEDAETTTALVKDALDGVSRVPTDGAFVEAELGRAESLTRERMRRMGTSPELVDRAVREMRSGARMAQVEALIAADQIDVADTVIAEYGDEFQGQDLQKARALAEAEGLRVRSQREADAIFTAYAGDETAGYAAVRVHEGKMRDEVERRLGVLYGRAEQAKRDRIAEVGTRAESAVLQGQPISARDRAYLTLNAPRVLASLDKAAADVATGEPITTDWETYYDLSQMSATEFRNVNLLEYRDRLSDTDFKEMVRLQAADNVTGGRGTEATMAATAQKDYLFNRLRQIEGVFKRDMARYGDIKKGSEDATKFAEFTMAVDAEIARRVAAQNGRRLSDPETRAAIDLVVDTRALKRFGFDRIRQSPTQMPRAATTYPPRAGMTREAYYDYLTSRGVSPQDATNAALAAIAP